MSEEAGAPAAPEGAGFESGQEPVSTPAAEPQASEPTTDPFDSEEVQTFDRDYVTRLREEAASHRTKARTYTDAFDGYDEGSQGAWLNIINLAKTDERAAAELMLQIANSVLTPEEAAAEAAAATGDGEEDRPLTLKEYEELKAKEAAEAAQAAQLQALNKEVTELGYKIPAEGEEVPFETAALLWFAQNQTNGDIPKAHEKFGEFRQSIIDGYVQEAAQKGSAFTRQARRTGVAPSTAAEPPKTFKDGHAAFEAWMAGQAG